MSREPLTRNQRYEMVRQSEKPMCIPWAPSFVLRYEATVTAVEMTVSELREEIRRLRGALERLSHQTCEACEGSGEIRWLVCPPDPQTEMSATCPECRGEGEQ